MTKKRIYWVTHTVYWTINEGHNFVLAIYYGADIKDIYAETLLEFVILFTLTHLFGEFIYERQYTIKDWKFVLFLSVLVCNILSFLIAYLHIYFFGFALKPYMFSSSTIPFSLIMYLDSLGYIYPWFGVFHILRILNANFKIIKNQDEFNISLKIAELENLKNQLNPHFLFNSLNSIKALTLSNITLAREAIIELAELLRTSLDFKNTPEIFLHQEIDLVEKYLMLEKIRFGERLNYTINISNEISSSKILPMSIQLLVENAIKHGVNNSKKGGYISILGYRDEHFVFIQVKNAGKITINSRKGIGLENLDKRLALNYGKEAKFTLQELAGEVVAEIQTPCVI
jgi:sensor histidine kinase YesM